MTQTLTAPPPPAADRAPFARLRIGAKTFDIAEDSPPDSPLCFREAGRPLWITLRAGLEDGWHRIGADILQADPQVLAHFLRTHAVRLGGWYRTGETIEFDTLGTLWSVSCTDEDQAQVVFDGRPPVAVARARATSADPREQAIDLLIAAVPDLGQVFHPKMDEWAGRLAAGASVTPVM